MKSSIILLFKQKLLQTPWCCLHLYWQLQVKIVSQNCHTVSHTPLSYSVIMNLRKKYQPQCSSFCVKSSYFCSASSPKEWKFLSLSNKMADGVFKDTPARRFHLAISIFDNRNWTTLKCSYEATKMACFKTRF